MADGKIRVSFEPKGDKELIDAIKSLNRETKKLRGINVLTEKSVDKLSKAKGGQRRNTDKLDTPDFLIASLYLRPVLASTTGLRERL